MDLKTVLKVIERKNEIILHGIRESWEQTRWLGSVILQPHAKKNRSIKPSDLMKFPWDEKPNRKPQMTKSGKSFLKSGTLKWQQKQAK
jgi:hypothetical protein